MSDKGKGHLKAVDAKPGSRTSHSKRQSGISSDTEHSAVEGLKFVRTLGYGSYSTVKEAYSAKHQGRVAVKLMNKKNIPQDFFAKFVPREIEVLKKLSHHSSLVQCYEAIETADSIYFVMEICDNGDLLDMIKSQKFIRETQAGRWFHQLHSGVSFIHSKGIAHRDLKCENLLLDKQNNLKITDFGFARPVRSIDKLSGNDKKILSETYCGSYAYAPPEILVGTPYDPQKADVWSMGVILFAMLCGRLPFDDTNHRILIREVNSKVKFPLYPHVADDCKCLLIDIFVRADDRPSLERIKQNAWYRRVRPETPPLAHSDAVSVPVKSDDN